MTRSIEPEPLQTEHSDLYRRRPRSVFRVLEGRALIAAPGHSTVGVEGSAVLVWVAFDEEPTTRSEPTTPSEPKPAHDHPWVTSAELTARINGSWPELADVSESDVEGALVALVDHGLVERELLEGQP